MEQLQLDVESTAAPIASSQAVPVSDASTAKPCESGDLVNDATSSEKIDESTNEFVPQSAGGALPDCARESAVTEDTEGMAAWSVAQSILTRMIK